MVYVREHMEPVRLAPSSLYCTCNCSKRFSTYLLVPGLTRYDKARIAAKEIMHTGYVACMDPAAGSGCITPRLQRHFATFAVTCPAPASAQ